MSYQSATQVTLSANAVGNANPTNLTVALGAGRTVTGTLTAGAATVMNTVPPGTSSTVATLSCASACFLSTDAGLDVNDPGNVHLSLGTVIVSVSGDGKTATLSRDAIGGTTAGLVVTVGPAHGYCRPTGGNSNTPYCAPSETTPWGDSRAEKLLTTGDILSISPTSPQNHGNDTLYRPGA